MEIIHEPALVLAILRDLAPGQAARLDADPRLPTSFISRLTPLTAVAVIIVRKRGVYLAARGDLLPVLDWYEAQCKRHGLGSMDQEKARHFGLWMAHA